MGKKQLYVTKIYDNLYALDEAHQSCGFLVIGEEKACLIDTMFGNCYNFEDIRKITDKPVFVINTHGHGDHVFGNIHFEKAYIHPDDLEEAKSFLKHARLIYPSRWFNSKCASFEMIKEGDKINIGGLDLEIYDLPGHTKGGIVILCPQLRVLFSGDGINHHLWMWLKGCVPVSEMRDNLKKLLPLKDRADYILHGHSSELNDISLMGAVIEGADEIARGDTKDDAVIKLRGTKINRHTFKVPEGGKFNSEEHFIFYPYKK